MDAKTITVLKAARALIAKPESWCQNFVSLDNRGEPIGYEQSDAVSFCALGAILRAEHDIGTSSRAWDVLKDAMGGGVCAIPTFNNSRTHAEVLAKFDGLTGESSPRPTNISIFTDMLTTQAPLVEHQSAVDTCGNG